MKKLVVCLLLAMFGFFSVILLCYKGIKVNHGVEMNGGKQKITIPESTNTIEIERRNGKEPFRFNIKTPQKQIEIERVP